VPRFVVTGFDVVPGLDDGVDSDPELPTSAAIACAESASKKPEASAAENLAILSLHLLDVVLRLSGSIDEAK